MRGNCIKGAGQVSADAATHEMAWASSGRVQEIAALTLRGSVGVAETKESHALAWMQLHGDSTRIAVAIVSVDSVAYWAAAAIAAVCQCQQH